jgi:hypothetical protein
MVWERNIARRWQSFSPLSTQQLEQAYADKDIQQNPLVLSLQLGEQEKEV